MTTWLHAAWLGLALRITSPTPPPPPLCTLPAFLAEDGRGAKSNLYRDFLNFLLLHVQIMLYKKSPWNEEDFSIDWNTEWIRVSEYEFLNAAVMLTYPDPPFFVPLPHMNVEATDKCCISCIVQCQGWAQSSKNPTIESIPAPQAPGVRSPGQRAQNTTNNPSPLDRALSGADREAIWRQGIFVFLTFLYPYLPLVEGLNYYTWFNFESWRKD